MKVASVEWNRVSEDEWDSEALINQMQRDAKLAEQQGADLIVFPGFAGLLHLHLRHPRSTLRELAEAAFADSYLDAVCAISQEAAVAICPGSYWVREGDQVFHASCMIDQGRICCEQKQIYLARWEQDVGLGRGMEQHTWLYDGWRIGIVVGTDGCYPQVSRALALMETDLVVAPIGWVGKPNFWHQLSGMWKDVQQNQFFAVESGFNGLMAGTEFWGESMIHAPVEMTPNEDGFLCRTGRLDSTAGEMNRAPQSRIIFAGLDQTRRQQAIAGFDVLGQLHPELYRRMRLFGGI